LFCAGQTLKFDTFTGGVVMAGSAPQTGLTCDQRDLSSIVAAGAFVPAPGVYDALSARLAQRSGFQTVYASGGSIVRSFGLPDMGLATLSEMAARFAQIAGAVGIPVIADGDTGFGNELNITRTVHILEQTGIAAVHFEDQAFPKRCGHDAGVQLIDAVSMVKKLAAAGKSRSRRNLMIIARTDALSVEGPAAAIERAQLYEDAGADMIFVEGLRAASDVEAAGRALRTPKILNCGPPGSPLPLPADELAELGFRIGIYPADLQCAAITAMQECLTVLRRDGNSGVLRDRLASLADRDDLVDIQFWRALEKGSAP
jgi:2-methylisocitrate lyase-like PEP mutase family enzyme